MTPIIKRSYVRARVYLLFQTANNNSTETIEYRSGVRDACRYLMDHKSRLHYFSQGELGEFSDYLHVIPTRYEKMLPWVRFYLRQLFT